MISLRQWLKVKTLIAIVALSQLPTFGAQDSPTEIMSTVDFGRVERFFGQKLVKQVEIENVSTLPLPVNSWEIGCGCIEADGLKSGVVVQPKERLTFNVSLDPSRASPGKRTEWISFNSPDRVPSLRVRVNYEGMPFAIPSEASVIFGLIDVNGVRGNVLLDVLDEGLEAVEVRSASGYQVEILSQKVQFSAAGRKQVAIQLFFREPHLMTNISEVIFSPRGRPDVGIQLSFLKPGARELALVPPAIRMGKMRRSTEVRLLDFSASWWIDDVDVSGLPLSVGVRPGVKSEGGRQTTIELVRTSDNDFEAGVVKVHVQAEDPARELILELPVVLE
jgi:hypothetical protein